MREAPILVKRRGPMIGRPDSTPRIDTKYYAVSVAEALAWIRSTGSMYPSSAFWIERRGARAHV